MAAPNPEVQEQLLSQSVATVSVGPVERDEIDYQGNTSFFATPSKYRDDAGLFVDCRIRHRYETDHHRYMLGVTKTGVGPAFVQLAGKTLLWICDWTVCRKIEQPIMPDPTPVVGDWVLLDEHYEPANIITAPDCTTPTYRISGTYIYGYRSPPDRILDVVRFPLSAWLRNEFDRSMPAKYVERNLTDGDARQGAQQQVQSPFQQ